MEFPKLLLHIGLILATVTDLCVADDPNPIHRLPTNSAPFDYNLSLIIPDLEKSNTFHGEIRVTVTIFRDLFDISLHSQGLEINKTATTLTTTTPATLTNNTITYKPTEHTYDHETNILTLHFERQLFCGTSYILNMKFAGNFSQTDLFGLGGGGFIKIPYTDEEGYKKYNRTLAATYFMPNKARRMFPCWDEPGINAIFYISVMHHQKYMALSNWPIREQYNVENDMKWTHFDRTNLVSAYLVGIVIVSDFDRVNNTDQSVNVWCRSSLTSSARFVQSIAERVTPLLEKYTDRTKGVPKIDHVMIPDYTTASMGDWGIIIYRESKVVYDESRDPTFRRKEVASLVAYEIAHQWFGNFITPLWWTDMWLNEGFAVYFQAYFLDKLQIGFKDSRSMDLFVTGAMHHALHLDDGLLGSVTLNLYDDDTLNNQLFVDQVREKAPAILRMLHHAVGDEVFRKGITKYFATKYQYSAVTPDDFWRAIQSAEDEPSYPPRYRYYMNIRIKEVMDMWIVQNRYPVLNVTMNYHTGNYKTAGELVITQKCFHATEGTNNKWWIPITYTDESRLNFSNTMPIFWLEPDETLKIPINTLGWIIVNLQQTAYCRVYYDTGIYERIIPFLGSQEHTKIHVLNRAQIIDDAYAFLLEDQLESSIFNYLIAYYTFERDYVAWRPMFRILERNEKYFSLPESKGFKLYMVQNFNGVLQHLGYEENPDDDDLTKLLRLEATKWACTVGHAKCKRSAAVKLSEHLADPDTHKIPYWWQNWTYCFGLAVANKTTWDKMMERYVLTPNDNLLKNLNCAENPDIIINYLNITASNTTLFKDLDHVFIFNLILENHARNDLVLDYILANFDNIKPRLLPATQTIFTVYHNVYSNEQLSKVNTFAGKYFHQDRDALARVTFMIQTRRNKLKASVDIFTKRFGKSQTLIDQLQKLDYDEEDVNTGLVNKDEDIVITQDLSA
ncbi:aminopeptidase N-like [Temnothorax longispinosus]|uniref:aminopeptidase N-like n=1 Tax=Temnothorax longispinosus TaxID=300112 RepID=UPI003A997408